VAAIEPPPPDDDGEDDHDGPEHRGLALKPLEHAIGQQVEQSEVLRCLSRDHL